MVIKFFGIETCALARRGNPASGPVNIFRIHVARAGLQTPPTHIGVTNPSYTYRGYKPLLHISGLQTPPTYIGVTNPSYTYRGYKPLLHISGLQTPPTHIGVTNPSYTYRGYKPLLQEKRNTYWDHAKRTPNFTFAPGSVAIFGYSSNRSSKSTTG